MRWRLPAFPPRSGSSSGEWSANEMVSGLDMGTHSTGQDPGGKEGIEDLVAVAIFSVENTIDDLNILGIGGSVVLAGILADIEDGVRFAAVGIGRGVDYTVEFAGVAVRGDPIAADILVVGSAGQLVENRVIVGIPVIEKIHIDDKRAVGRVDDGLPDLHLGIPGGAAEVDECRKG